MNFLAHLFLSGANEDIMLGNFLGDFIKGSDFNGFDPNIIKGIQLHRSIDYFTDHNEITSKSKQRLTPKYRHYSSVIIDIFYDHFLAKNWADYSNEELQTFAKKVYTIIGKNKDILPEKALYVYPFMVKANWLYNYQFLEGVSNTLNGMAKRASFDSKMDEAIIELEEYYLDFENDFKEFFPTLQNHCKEFMRNND